jgi:hypothetical protein
LVAILDSLAKPNSHLEVGEELGKWLEAVCREKSPRKPKIVFVQVKVGLSQGFQNPMASHFPVRFPVSPISVTVVYMFSTLSGSSSHLLSH